MRVFILDHDPLDVQTLADRLTAMEHEVAGTATGQAAAAAAIKALRPDAVVVRADRDPERTAEILRAAIHEGDVAPLPVVFIDALDRYRHMLERHAAPAVFTDMGHIEEGLRDLQKAVRNAKKAAKHVEEDHPMAEHAPA